EVSQVSLLDVHPGHLGQRRRMAIDQFAELERQAGNRLELKLCDEIKDGELVALLPMTRVHPPLAMVTGCHCSILTGAAGDYKSMPIFTRNNNTQRPAGSLRISAPQCEPEIQASPL